MLHELKQITRITRIMFQSHKLEFITLPESYRDKRICYYHLR